jgi:hypothetical protein
MHKREYRTTSHGHVINGVIRKQAKAFKARMQHVFRICARGPSAFVLDINDVAVTLLSLTTERIYMKRMTTYTIAVLFATIAVSIAAPDKDAIMAKETAAWQAFKDKKADDFKKVIAANFLAVYAEGTSDMGKELSDMQKWDMKSFTISDYNAVSDENDVVVTTYKVTLEGTYDGKDASGTYNAGSVWKMRNGSWLGIFHTNVKEAAAK